MQETFYITSPIYYVNDEPHLGHAYTTIFADVLVRYACLQGKRTHFVTGVDEHGQKVQQAAKKHNLDPQTYSNQVADRFRQTWQHLRLSYDDFIRTSEPRHRRVVTHILQTLWEKGEIYRADYEGWYCVSDERFWTEKDLINGQCPDCHRPVERLVEANYFFRMSAYQNWLIETITQNPTLIQPETRRNEVLGFLQKPLGDLCISRPVSRVSWGIPLPFDADYVTYVWFDALLNYITTLGYLSEEDAPGQSPTFQAFWPAANHLIGKDILITHTVYWTTMLKAIGLPLPQRILVHGWWTIDGQKMGKSLGNAVQPLQLADRYGVDAFRYFLLRDMTLGRDADFSEAGLRRRYESDLANDLGNLLHRVVSMLNRYCEGEIPAVQAHTAADAQLRETIIALPEQVFAQVDALAVNEALALSLDAVRQINGYLEQEAPWRQAKAGRSDRVAAILYAAAEALRLVSILLHPVLPERTVELWSRLGWEPAPSLQAGLTWGQLAPGSKVRLREPLFPKDLTPT